MQRQSAAGERYGLSPSSPGGGTRGGAKSAAAAEASSATAGSRIQASPSSTISLPQTRHRAACQSTSRMADPHAGQRRVRSKNGIASQAMGPRNTAHVKLFQTFRLAIQAKSAARGAHSHRFAVKAQRMPPIFAIVNSANSGQVMVGFHFDNFVATVIVANIRDYPRRAGPGNPQSATPDPKAAARILPASNIRLRNRSKSNPIDGAMASAGWRTSVVPRANKRRKALSINTFITFVRRLRCRRPLFRHAPCKRVSPSRPA